ncbi:MAG: hypothetical protein AAGH15_01450 [Myxococcota bacterium]
MLFKKRFWAGLESGAVTLAFRRWKRPTVRVGGTLQSPVGRLAIEAVEQTRLADITAADAEAAGYASKAELLKALRRQDPAPLYRVRLRFVGGDPRVALRADDALDAPALAALLASLERSDARSGGAPWTHRMLQTLSEEPGRRAGDLAPRFEVDLPTFKARVRRLKALGLTESLQVGYRLSPRGHRVLEALARRRDEE